MNTKKDNFKAILIGILVLGFWLFAFAPSPAAAPGDINTVAGNGTFGFSGDGGPATSASMSNPEGVFVDGLGNIYIADERNHRIRKVDTSGNITTVAGNGIAAFSGDGGPATSASLRFPTGVFVDGSGVIYIADSQNDRIRKVNTLGIISTVAGGGFAEFFSAGRLATDASLAGPTGVYVDGLGNIYIADTGSHRLHKVDTLGIISTVAGDGTAAFSGDGGPATSAWLSLPRGVFVDGSGNIYIADYNNQRIRKVDTSGIINTVAGNGTGGFSGDGGPATSASLNFPVGVFVDGLGNIYFADSSNHRIRKVDTSGNIFTVAGSGGTGFGAGGFSGDGGPAASASLNFPNGVFVDGLGNIYIADSNYRIRKVEPAPDIAVSPGSLNFGLVEAGVQKSDTLTVSNAGYDTLRISSITTNTSPQPFDAFPVGPLPAAVPPGALMKIVVQFRPPFVATVSTFTDTVKITSNDPDTGIFRVPLIGQSPSPNIVVNPTSLNFGPVDVGASKSDSVVVTNSGTDTLNISTISTSLPFSALPIGPLVVLAGGSSTIEVRFEPGNVGVFSDSLTINSNDLDSPVVKVPLLGFVPQAAEPSIITTVAGDGFSDVFGNGRFSGDGGPATSASMFSPKGVAVDELGNLYIADERNHRIRKVDTSGNISTVAGSGTATFGGFSGDGGPATSASLAFPNDVFVDGSGNIYIADTVNNRIRKVDTSGIISTVAGNGILAFSGDGGPATSASLFFPNDVFVDGSGNIYIADTENNRIRKVDALGIISTVAGSGTFGDLGDGGQATSATLRVPRDLFVDGLGNIYIADNSNQRIRKVDTSGIISTVAGGGTFGVLGDGGPATSAYLGGPVSVFVGGLGNIYIATVNDNRIRKVDTSGIISTVAGNGIAAFSGDGGPATSASLDRPTGVFVDGLAKIYIADSVNNRIRLVRFGPIIAVNPPSVNFGNVKVGGGKVDTVEVNNTGIGTLSISSFSTFAPFSAVSIGPVSVPPEGLSEIEVTFQPGSVGAFNDTLTINSNDPESPVVKVPLSGIGFVQPPVGDLSNTKIAFRSDRDGNNEIYVMDADGRNLIKLTNDPGSDGGPSWSPDGTKIAFVSERDLNSEIYKMDANGTNLLNLTNDPASDGRPSWSPDGTKIAFNSDRNGNNQIYVMDPDGLNQTRLTNNPDNDRHPNWSPDGTKIAFVSDRNGNNQIYVMGADGLNQTRVTTNSANDGGPSWSPDGTKIAFDSDREGNTQIYVMDPDGLNQTRLTNNTANDGQPSWSPDGTKIAFFSNRDGDEEIYVMDPDGLNQTELTGNSIRDDQPSWSSFLPSPGPKIAVNPDSVNFGTVSVGGSKLDTVMVNNAGGDTLDITGLSPAPPSLPFSASLIGPNRIAPGGFTKIEVKFQPDSVRVFSDSLTIISNDPDSPVKVPLTGEGALNPGPDISNVFPSRDLVPIGAHVRIFADVTDEDGVASVTANIFDANDAGFTPAQLTLFNDGEHKDGLPGDRLWGSEPWPTPADRPREFLVNILAADSLGAESHADSAASFATADSSIFVTVGAGDEIAGPGGQAEVSIFASNLTGQNVLSGEITLGFDPALVQFVRAFPGQQPIEGFDSNSPEPGKAIVVFASTSPLLDTPDSTLAVVLFQVNPNAPLGSSMRVSVEQANLNEGFPPIVTFDGTVTVKLVGDLSRNGEVKAFDVSLMLMHLVEIKNVIDEFFGGDVGLFVAISDVTRNGGVTSFDAARVLQFLVGKIPGLPFHGHDSIPKAVDVAARTVSISDRFELSDDTIKFPLSIDDMSGVLGADISLSYDASRLKPVGVSPSDMLSSFMFQSNIEDNEVKIAFASAEGVEGSGDVAYIEFEIIPGAGDNLGDDLLKISDVQLNEGLIPVVIEQTELSLAVIPEVYALSQNYPNPFNPETVIHYDLPVRSRVDISVFNLIGQKVATLVAVEMDAGSHSVVWNAKDSNGENLASGVYLYRMEAGGSETFVRTRKLILLR